MRRSKSVCGKQPRRSVVWRASVGGVAVAVSSGLIGGAAPAGAQQERTAVANCTRVTSNEPSLSGTITGFPADETFLFFALLRFGNGNQAVLQGYSITTDSNGTGSTPSYVAFVLPVDTGLAVYRDTNGNRRWDPDADDTLYRGSATVGECPQSVTMTPK